MNASIDLIGRLVGAFEEHAAAWKNGREDAAQCREVEEIIDIALRLFTGLHDSLATLRQVTLKAAGAENVDAVLWEKEMARLNQRFCNSFKRYESAITALREKGYEVSGSEQFLGCIRDAERDFQRWQTDQVKAMELRAEWLRAAGVSEGEINDLCDPNNYPGDVQAEEGNVRAQKDLAKNAWPKEAWDKIAQRCVSAKAPAAD